MQSTITRRAALTGTAAGAAAIVAGTVPALAVETSDDLIIAAIEAHKVAMERHEAAIGAQDVPDHKGGGVGRKPRDCLPDLLGHVDTPPDDRERAVRRMHRAAHQMWMPEQSHSLRL